VVFATGDDLSEEASAFVRRTGCLVLSKPFDPGALAALARHPANGDAGPDAAGALADLPADVATATAAGAPGEIAPAGDVRDTSGQMRRPDSADLA
jgi:hypothetical protein